MTKERFNNKPLFFILLAIILFLTVSMTVILSVPMSNQAKAEGILVDITLQSNELTYNSENYLLYDGANYYPNAELFGLLVFTDHVTGLPVEDIINTEIKITSHTEIKNVNIYAIMFEINEDVSSYSGSATLNIEVTKKEIDAVAGNFIGFNTIKEYDCTTSVKLYDEIYYLSEYLPSVFELVSDDLLHSEYGFEDTSLWQQMYLDTGNIDYVILRISYYDVINFFMKGYSDAIEARDYALDFLNDLITEFDNNDYSYQQFDGESLAGLYLTEYHELISFIQADSTIAQYDTKDVEINNTYTIDLTDLECDNYSFSQTYVQGSNGLITPAIVGIVNPTLEINYGDSYPTSFDVEMIDGTLLNNYLVENATINGHELSLPYHIRLMDIFINRVLSDFYMDDILYDQDISAIYNAGNISLPFAFDADETCEGNVYRDIEDITGTPTRYNLAYLESTKNYYFFDILNLYEVEGYYVSPGLVINPKTVTLDDLTTNTIKIYDGNDEINFTSSSQSGFLLGEEDLYDLEIIAHFKNGLDQLEPNVTNNMNLSDFQFSFQPKDEIFDIKAYNYTVDKQNFAAYLASDTDLIVELMLTNQPDIWINYASTYSHDDILTLKIEGVTSGIVGVEQATLNISLIPEQRLIYGNDILAGLLIDYENFYQENPQSIFSFQYKVMQDGIEKIDPGNNSFATQLLPSLNSYDINLIDTNVVIDSEWASLYGGNYSINIDTSSIVVYIDKGYIENIEIQNVDKYFGQDDPELSFVSIQNYRDSDLDAIISLLYRTGDENVGHKDILLDYHEYYDYSSYGVGQFEINVLTIEIMPEAIEIPYGTASNEYYTYDIENHYQVITESETQQNPYVDINYYCYFSSLNATQDFVHEIIAVNVAQTDPNYNNIAFTVINGQNKVKINALDVELDFSQMSEIQKVFDQTPLAFNVKNETEVMYAVDLYDQYNPDYPISYEDRFGEAPNMSLDLPYGEKLFFIKVKGYSQEDSEYERIKAGEKYLYIEVYIIKADNGVDYYLADNSNYNFIVASQGQPIYGEITPKPINITPSEISPKNKIYDGQALTAEAVTNELFDGHYLCNNNILFQTVSNNASPAGILLELIYNPSDILVTDTGDEYGFDYSENYVLVYNDDSYANISSRQISINLSSSVQEILTTYRGEKIAIALSYDQIMQTYTGSLYSQSLSDGTYTQILDGNGQVIVRDLSLINILSSEQSALVSDHYLSGKIITLDSSVGLKAMVQDEDFVIVNSEAINYAIEINIKINIIQKNLELDINPEQEVLQKEYDSQIYAITLSNDNANAALIGGHSLLGSITTRGYNAAVYDINNSSDFDKIVTIQDQSSNDVTSNYNIIYTSRSITILPRSVVININLDELVSKEKFYDGNTFKINITDSMVDGLVAGETVFAGTISTQDANTYTIVEGQEQFIPKKVYFTQDIDQSIEIKTINGSITTTNNYAFSFGEDNYVSINPKDVRLDIQNEYYNIQAVYSGSLIEFQVTKYMIINMNNNNYGLIGSHDINTELSLPLRSETKDVADNISLLYDYVVIEDLLTTQNYNIHYVPTEISIIKREITINVEKDGDYQNTHTYNGKKYQIALSKIMDDHDELELNKGLVLDHYIQGVAETNGTDVGIYPLFYTFAILDGENNDISDNYLVSNSGVSVRITPKDLGLYVNETRIYDDTIQTVWITNDMLSVGGLLNNQEDDLVDVLQENVSSYFKTQSKNVGDYIPDPTNPSVFSIEIIRQDTLQDVTNNYNIIMEQASSISIQKRTIHVKAADENGYVDGQEYCSGLSYVYKGEPYVVNSDYYIVENIIGNHIFVSGSLITQTFDVSLKVYLILNTNQTVRINNPDDNNSNVTNNYEIVYDTCYLEIYKRKILIDVARNQQGNTDEYDLYGHFIHNYDANIYQQKIEYYMIKVMDDYRELVIGQRIVGDYYIFTEDADVNKDIYGNVIPKTLVWDPEKILIERTDYPQQDVNSNYDIHFVERFVEIQPRLLVIDVKRGIQTDFSRPYDGTKYTVDINNTKIVDDIPSLYNRGLIYGHSINQGQLITENADVEFDNQMNIIYKSLFMSQDNPTLIVNPLGYEVTGNYDIRYHQNVNSEEAWQNILLGESYQNYESYLPKARITKKNLVFSLSTTEKIKKYYDGQPFAVTAKYIYNPMRGMLEFELQGKSINSDKEALFIMGGLVEGESASFALTTADEKEGAQKSWIYNIDNVSITKQDEQDSKSNYNIQSQMTNFAHIRKRQICVDVNEIGAITHIYDGNYFEIQLENSMVLNNRDDEHEMMHYTDSLGILPGHTIQGIKKSTSINVGSHYLETIQSDPIIILNELNQDITNQYTINEAPDQNVLIMKANIIIDPNNIDIPKTKIYDGTPFVISLSEQGIAIGLIEGHFVDSGYITTLDKHIGETKETECDFDNIVIKQIMQGADDIDVTYNYSFTFIDTILSITPKPVQIMKDADYYKPYNDKTDVNLAPKHYKFGPNDIYPDDTVILIGYSASFSNYQDQGTGEIIEVTDLVIDNQDYTLINESFQITGQIVSHTPIVQVENSVQIKNRDGVVFVYDGTPKEVSYTILGLDGAYVEHLIEYQDDSDESNPTFTSPPINAGLYKMIFICDDDDYPYWQGDTVMIQINPATVNIAFNGSLNQTYGSVTEVTARITSPGLNIRFIPECVPVNSAGYAYPEAGEYELKVDYNMDTQSSNYSSNYYSATKSVRLIINKKDIEVTYGDVSNLFYDGTVKNIAVSIKTGILPGDSGVVNDSSLVLSYSGENSYVKDAGSYVLTVSINNLNYNVANNSIDFQVQKKELTVSALINNSARLSVNEGDPIIESIVYAGFVNGEDRSYLQKPAYVNSIPKRAINDFRLMPFGAESINYYFTYVPAYITILEKKVSQIIDEQGIAILLGDYGSFANLKAQAIQADITDPKFYVINENVKKNFASTDLLDKYKIEMAYNLSILDSESQPQAATIKLKLSEDMLKQDNFMVIHFSDNGEYEMVGGIIEGEYIVFNATDIGDFVILSQRKGMSSSIVILLFLAPIALFVLAILFYIMFRRKYDID